MEKVNEMFRMVNNGESRLERASFPREYFEELCNTIAELPLEEYREVTFHLGCSFDKCNVEFIKG